MGFLNIVNYSTLGIFMAVVIAVVSMTNVGLYAGSRNGSDSNCWGYGTATFQVSDRVVGLGETVTILSIISSVVCIALWAVLQFTDHSTNKHYACTGVVVGLSAFMFAFWIVPWSLLAESMAYIDDNYGDCEMPYTWSATFFFSLFDWLLWLVMLLNGVVALIVDRNGN
jgi:amino acid permease